MIMPTQSITHMDPQSEAGCAGCSREPIDEYQLVLDGGQLISLALCEECYEQCYEEILRVDWIEEPE